MKKQLLIFLLCLSCYSIFAQDSLQNQASQLPNYVDSPLIVIKGEEIRRFPPGNFLEAINGMFPWVFSQTPDANNFLFVVNGFILPDINGISLYDIEEVTFTRNKLNGNMYPLSRAGTFYIKTKTVNSPRPVINFNSHYNILWNKNALIRDLNIPYFASSRENHSRNKPGNFFSNQVSLAAGSSKFHLYASAGFDAIKEPPLYQQSFYNILSAGKDTAIGDLKAKQYNLKTFLSLEYRFTGRLRGGITGNYFRGHAKELKDFNKYSYAGSADTSDESNHTTLSYYHIGSFINWEISPKLRNIVYAEYGDNKFNYRKTVDQINYQNGNFFAATITENKTEPSYKRYLLRNQLEYDFLSRGKFTLTGVAIFSYLHNKVSSATTTTVTRNNSIYSVSGMSYHFKEKITSLNPLVRFSWSNFLSGHAGYAIMVNKWISGFDRRSRSNPYAGLMLDIKNILKIGNPVSRLDFFFNYGDMSQNTSNSYWLPAMADPEQFRSHRQLNEIYSSSQVITFPNPALSTVILKNKLTAFGVNSGFINNKILAGIEWSGLRLQRIYMVPLPVYQGTAYIAMLGNETQKGVSFFASGKLLDKPRRHWDMRLNLLFPYIKHYINATVKPDVFPVNYFMQAGLQNRLQFGEWHIQANALYGLNREYFIINSGGRRIPEKLNEFVLNYLLLAYDLSQSKNIFLKNTSVFVQGRNLFSSKKAKEYYQYASYGGMGINFKL